MPLSETKRSCEAHVFSPFISIMENNHKNDYLLTKHLQQKLSTQKSIIRKSRYFSFGLNSFVYSIIHLVYNIIYILKKAAFLVKQKNMVGQCCRGALSCCFVNLPKPGKKLGSFQLLFQSADKVWQMLKYGYSEPQNPFQSPDKVQ